MHEHFFFPFLKPLLFFFFLSNSETLNTGQIYCPFLFIASGFCTIKAIPTLRFLNNSSIMIFGCSLIDNTVYLPAKWEGCEKG